MEFDKIVEKIELSYNEHNNISKINTDGDPDKDIILNVLSCLQDIVFPGFFGDKNLNDQNIKYYIGNQLQFVYYELKQQIILAFHGDKYQDYTQEKKEAEAERIIEEFLNTIPTIREYLSTDAEATFEGDPAAISIAEIVYSYPGFYAIMVNRIAHELYKLGVPLIPRIMTEHAHSKTGIDIHPGATLGKYLMIDHGTGIVVGETTVIGEHVQIYQGVTLGAISTHGGQSLRNVRRHPTIENNVTIYSNASVLGGDTVIGEGSIIGGNTFITKSVPANTVVNNKAVMRFKNFEQTEDLNQGKF